MVVNTWPAQPGEGEELRVVPGRDSSEMAAIVGEAPAPNRICCVCVDHAHSVVVVAMTVRVGKMNVRAQL